MSSEALNKILDNPASKLVYERLLEVLDGVGEYEIEGKKTSLHISHGRAFLGVAPRKGGLQLTIVTTDELKSDRVKKTEQVSVHRWHCEILLTEPQQLDTELVGWIHAAYELTMSL